MATRYYIRLPDPKQARGSEPGLAFHSDSAGGFAEELQAALRTPALFERWKAMQEEPDEVDASLGATDPAATVTGEQSDLDVLLVVNSSISGSVFKQRMRWLAGSNWQMQDIKAG